MKDLVTLLEKMNEFCDVYKAIEFAQTQYGDYLEKPKKPFLATKHTSEDAKIYVEVLLQYEQEISSYHESKKDWQQNVDSINNVIVQYIKDSVGFSNVPKQYQDKVYALAWSNGHSDGYYSIYEHLDVLVDIFY